MLWMKNELWMGSVLITLVSMEADVSDILGLEGTSAVTSFWTDKDMEK